MLIYQKSWAAVVTWVPVSSLSTLILLCKACIIEAICQWIHFNKKWGFSYEVKFCYRRAINVLLKQNMQLFVSPLSTADDVCWLWTSFSMIMRTIAPSFINRRYLTTSAMDFSFFFPLNISTIYLYLPPPKFSTQALSDIPNFE